MVLLRCGIQCYMSCEQLGANAKDCCFVVVVDFLHHAYSKSPDEKNGSDAALATGSTDRPRCHDSRGK